MEVSNLRLQGLVVNFVPVHDLHQLTLESLTIALSVQFFFFDLIE